MVLSFINQWVISIISDGTYCPIYNTAPEYIFVFHIFPLLKEPTAENQKKISIRLKNPLLKGRSTTAEEAGHSVRLIC